MRDRLEAPTHPEARMPAHSVHPDILTNEHAHSHSHSGAPIERDMPRESNMPPPPLPSAAGEGTVQHSTTYTHTARETQQRERGYAEEEGRQQ